jgi:hypothetical protein
MARGNRIPWQGSGARHMGVYFFAVQHFGRGVLVAPILLMENICWTILYLGGTLLIPIPFVRRHEDDTTSNSYWYYMRLAIISKIHSEHTYPRSKTPRSLGRDKHISETRTFPSDVWWWEVNYLPGQLTRRTLGIAETHREW